MGLVASRELNVHTLDLCTNGIQHVNLIFLFSTLYMILSPAIFWEQPHLKLWESVGNTLGGVNFH